jgi:enabled protein
MVGNNPKEDILISCKATAMIYNDAQKKWLHCASNGPAKIQLLYSSDTQTYRIVGRQIQDHEVVLNHSISKGIKYNQATPTFHQWRDQSCVYGLNFSSKLDAQEFGTTMMKILENVNGSNNNTSSHMIINGGATLPSSSSSTINNNNNNTPSYKRQSSQPPSSLPSTSATGTINSPSTPSDTQQQQHSSSPYTNHLRQNSNPLSSTQSSINNNYYSQQQHQSTEDEETNYALISDSYTYYGDNTNRNTNIPPAPPLNSSMSIPSGGAPPPPPPPLPNGFGNGPPPAPALILPNSGNTNTARKTNANNSAPPMDLMSEMAAKFAQRRKYIDENVTTDSCWTCNNITTRCKKNNRISIYIS